MTDPEVLWGIPGYSMWADDLARIYSDELQAALVDGTITDHIEKWKNAFLLNWENKPDHVQKIDAEIVNRDFNFEDALKCIAVSFEKGADGNPVEGRICEHQEHGLCHGMEIRMPYGLTVGVLVAARYGVPVGTAIHQAFCSGPHDGCF